MASRVIQGDVFDVLPTINAGSVDCVVSSPPYWMLRSYLPKGHPLKARELGSEPTPGEFVANMVKVFRLVRETMADHATCFLNMGDSYSSSPKGNPGDGLNANSRRLGKAESSFDKRYSGIDQGNLCLIPQRLAIAFQDDDWLVRSVVIWHKPAPMPASVAGWRWMRCRVKEKNGDKATMKYAGTNRLCDGLNNGTAAEWSDCPGCAKCKPNGGLVLRRGSWRPTSSYEPVLMLAKKPGYYCDGEAVKTPPKSATVSRDQYTRVLDDPDEQFAVRHDHETNAAGGANLRDVWTIAAEPLKEKHYAAFPTELVRLCLKAGTSEKGYCPTCGKPWARVVEVGPSHYATLGKDGADDVADDEKSPGRVGNTRTDNGTVPSYFSAQTETLGWRPTCPCPPHDPRPALVLDPFAGSGRTGVTAQRMFLDFIGVELNPEYHAMSERILRADCPLFSA